MPDDMRSNPGVPAERRKPIRTIDGFILLGLAIVMVGQFVSFRQNNHTQRNQDAGVIRGYINRAVTCDLIKGLGLHEPEGCADVVIMPYRDKKTQESSSTGATQTKRTRLTVCEFLEEQAKLDNRLAVPSDCRVP